MRINSPSASISRSSLHCSTGCSSLTGDMNFSATPRLHLRRRQMIVQPPVHVAGQRPPAHLQATRSAPISRGRRKKTETRGAIPQGGGAAGARGPRESDGEPGMVYGVEYAERRRTGRPPPPAFASSENSPGVAGVGWPGGHAEGVSAAMAELQSTITCPYCGHKAAETMPTNSCWYFYICRGCTMRLRPKAGDCCVFCSYGTVPCPPAQEVRQRATPRDNRFEPEAG
jgi:hypothetical protein